MSTTTELRPVFRQRFRKVTRQIWSLHVAQGVAQTIVAVVALVALAAAVDYIIELPWLVRASLAAAGVAFAAVLAVRWIIHPARTWNKVRVASELEGLFPRLGQRLRTATQHGGRPHDDLVREGVAPAMVAALEVETAEKFKPLPYQAALPVRPALVWSLVSLCSIAALAVLATYDSEWQIALRRVMLAPVSYTNLSATSSADLVDEGADVEIRATISGRPRSELVLYAREVGDPEWRTESMDNVDTEFTGRLYNLQSNTEFFVAAGPERTPVQQIAVRHPLKIVATRVEVTAPAYTGLALATHESGSFSAVHGSTARIQFDFDRSPTAATLVVKDPAKPTVPPRSIEMTVQNQHASAELTLTADVEYTVEARDAAGVPAAPNRHRARVTADQSPTVWFDSPSENMEVHTLAEVLMRAKAKDDFGLTKMGVTFQVNNEEERTLVLQDVDKPNQREALAEQMLMLEQFLLTQKDCVAYYAFAEDNRPDGSQRATTELRFIDIRPFLRTYQLIDPPENGGGQGKERPILGEVIAMQRFNLNQTMRLETRSRARIDLAQVERVAAFENKIATMAHDLADFLAGEGVDGAALLSQAEEAMLSAVDSLQNAKFTTAIDQERDALRFLMEARNTIRFALLKKPRAVQARARAFERLQRQKLRRPNDKAETLAQIADELAKLANEEDEVANMLAMSGNNPAGGNSGQAGDPVEPKTKQSSPDKTDPADPTAKGAGADQKPEDKDGKGNEEPTRERQDDIAARATALEKVAATAKGLTGLSKNRIKDATQAANAGADALGQRDRPNARKEVDRARENFRLAAKQVAALAAQEVAQQIAAARDLANDVALQTAPGDPMNTGGGAGEKDKKMPDLGNAAEQAKSLKDVLEQIAGAGAEGSAEAARKVAGLMKQEDLKAAIERLEKPGTGKDRDERHDLSERFAALGQKLDQVYRETIAPRLEEIARLEREANELEQRAASVDDVADWRRLRQQGAAFAERLEVAGLANLVDEDFRTGLGNVAVASGRELFHRGIANIHSKLATKLQEFVAGDRFTTGNEAVPPEYKDLVDRYLRALSAGSMK
jgi:hypothetical protein